MATKASIRQMRYDKAHQKQYNIKMHLVYDKDIIEKLSSVPSVMGYIKQLIRQDIRTCSVPEKRNDSVPDSNNEIVHVSVPKKFISDLQKEAKENNMSVSELIWSAALQDMPWLINTYKYSNSVLESFKDPYADTIAKAVGEWIDKSTSILSDEKPYVICDSAPKTEREEK